MGFVDPAEYLSREAIAPEVAGSLPGLLAARAAASPERPAYRRFDAGENRWVTLTWREVALEVDRWARALVAEKLPRGSRVAVMMKNCPEWAIFDLAAMRLGLVTVPLYADDRAENAAWILAHAEAKCLLVEGPVQHRKLRALIAQAPQLQRVLTLLPPEDGDDHGGRLVAVDAWLSRGAGGALPATLPGLEDTASIVYTSGTTGRPKGVMLSHGNILWNIWYTLHCGPFGADDVFLSFLPLSHTLERTCGLYLPMAVGAEVAFARSVVGLAQDLETLRPTVLISVPRIYERFYARLAETLARKGRLAQWLFARAVDIGWWRFEHLQGRAPWRPEFLLWPWLDRSIGAPLRARLGGRLKYAVSGGAALAPELARVFTGLGVPLYQGYGLTEASPVITVNRPGSNIPTSIGLPLPGVEVRLDENGELLTRSRCVMQGYWRDEEATHAAIDADGWLHTGDQANQDRYGHYHIVGRLKDIIVLSNGEKVPPADMETNITLDPLIAQAMIVGEGKPFLAAVVVLDGGQWPAFAQSLGLPAEEASLADSRVSKALLARIAARLSAFPGYAQVRRVHATLDEWSVDNGLLTPTLKIRRGALLEKYRAAIESMYKSLE